MLISFLIYIYIFPLLSPTLPSTSMHASTPLPFPPLGCPTQFYPPFPYSHYPSSPLHYHRIPPLNSAPLRSTLLPYPLIPYPTLPSHPPPLRCHIIHLASPTIPILSSTPLPSPRLPSPPLPTLPSTPFPYALSSHLLPFPIYPLLASAPYPTTLTPLHFLSHHLLLSPYPLT